MNHAKETFQIDRFNQGSRHLEGIEGGLNGINLVNRARITP